MNIIVLGQQGSGKGTQAEKLSEAFNLIHIDMGSTLREVAKTNSDLGREIYAIQNVTKTLVPSRILREVLHLKLGSIPLEQGIVFDGVPRTMDQADYIEQSLQDFGRQLDKVFFINISKEESINRISRRWTCKDCKISLVMGKDIRSEKDSCPGCGGEVSQRIDDTPEGIVKRLDVFNTQTLPVIDSYGQRNLVVKIDGHQDVEKVFADIIKHIEK